MYLVGKDADGGDTLEPGSADRAEIGSGSPATLNGSSVDIEEIRAEAARSAATALATATLNATDGDTAAHSDDVDVIADGICRHLGVTGRERENIIAAARLHDIGKVAMPSEVLEKPGPLDDAEWAVMRRHTVVGQQILDAVPEMEEVAKLVRHSHERWDGEGYPDGIADEEIPLGSRIVACADAYHAVRSDRSYRRGRDARDALTEICSCAGTQFDPEVTDALKMLAAETRVESGQVPGRRQSYRSTRLAALLLVLALGAGGSAIAHFAGAPLAPKAEAADPPAMPLPGIESPFTLPSLDDLPLLGLLDRAGQGPRPLGAQRDDAGEVAAARDRRPGGPGPAGAAVAATRDTPQGEGRHEAPPAGGGGGADRSPGNSSAGGTGGGNSGGNASQPNPPAGGNGSSGGGNGGGNGSSGGGNGGGGSSTPPPPEAPAPPPSPPHTPPGQVPGGNPGHGGLPPGNPHAPGHQPQGTPGHGGAIPGHGGTPPGQIQKDLRSTES